MINRRKVHDNLALGLIMLAALLAGIAATGGGPGAAIGFLTADAGASTGQAPTACERDARTLAADAYTDARAIDSGRRLVLVRERREDL